MKDNNFDLVSEILSKKGIDFNFSFEYGQSKTLVDAFNGWAYALTDQSDIIPLIQREEKEIKAPAILATNFIDIFGYTRNGIQTEYIAVLYFQVGKEYRCTMYGMSLNPLAVGLSIFNFQDEILKAAKDAQQYGFYDLAKLPEVAQN